MRVSREAVTTSRIRARARASRRRPDQALATAPTGCTVLRRAASTSPDRPRPDFAYRCACRRCTPRRSRSAPRAVDSYVRPSAYGEVPAMRPMRRSLLVRRRSSRARTSCRDQAGAATPRLRRSRRLVHGGAVHPQPDHSTRPAACAPTTTTRTGWRRAIHITLRDASCSGATIVEAHRSQGVDRRDERRRSSRACRPTRRSSRCRSAATTSASPRSCCAARVVAVRHAVPEPLRAQRRRRDRQQDHRDRADASTPRSTSIHARAPHARVLRARLPAILPDAGQRLLARRCRSRGTTCRTCGPGPSS